MKRQSLFATIPVVSFFIAFMLLSGGSIATASLSSLNGTISSIQNGSDGKPAWKVSGTWNLANLKSNSPLFNASFDMMKLDGSSKHQHTIGATITSGMIASTRTYSGTATISMKEGPISDVPIVIKLSSDGNVSIMPDRAKTMDHFGNIPIHGKTYN